MEHHCGLFYILTNAPLSENKGWSGWDYYMATCQVEEIHSSNCQVFFLSLYMYIYVRAPRIQVQEGGNISWKGFRDEKRKYWGMKLVSHVGPFGLAAWTYRGMYDAVGS